jgi:hypothetical protein
MCTLNNYCQFCVLLLVVVQPIQTANPEIAGIICKKSSHVA